MDQNVPLIDIRNLVKHFGSVIALSYMAARKPSCMDTSTTAKATPAMATHKRGFSRVSWSRARGTARLIMGPPRLPRS